MIFLALLLLNSLHETQPYDTLNDAAIAAEHVAMPLSKDYEYGGLLLERDGKFFYTDPMTSHHIAEVFIHQVFTSGYALVGLYHTHPGKQEIGTYFSSADIKTATTMKLTSYIGVTLDGSVHRFVPGYDSIHATIYGPMTQGEVL